MNWQDLSEDIADSCIDAFSESIEVHFFDKETSTFEIVATKAVYDAEYKQLDMQTGAVISSNSPMIELSKRFIENKVITSKDKIKARGTLYKVREVQPDASGAVKVLLSRS